MERLLRLQDVLARTGLSKSTIYRMVGAQTFPKPVKVGGKTVRWRESDIDGWMSQLAA